MRFFDVHTHLQFAAYDSDRAEVISRTLESGVFAVNIGTQIDTSKSALTLSKKYDGMWAAVGLHPIHTEKSFHDADELGGGEVAKEFTSRGEIFEYETYKKLASDSKAVAIGECGLDYYRLEEKTKILQRDIFEKQIELARELKKPLMIHCREAFLDLISILKSKKTDFSAPGGPGIVHFFSGSLDDAKKLLDLGFSFSFGGVVTFARSYDEQINYIPLERMLLETDAPYVAPVPYRGKRNEPSFIIETATKLAELKKVSLEELSETTFTNAAKVFSISL
ncbi:TatD family hydrolase [Candidatus Giovannonibacteria bacterium]|nr:TatD family hydrolase [Candidatus Giovannonibacteria bacterium]